MYRIVLTWDVANVWTIDTDCGTFTLTDFAVADGRTCTVDNANWWLVIEGDFGTNVISPGNYDFSFTGTNAQRVFNTGEFQIATFNDKNDDDMFALVDSSDPNGTVTNPLTFVAQSFDSISVSIVQTDTVTS